MPYTPTSNINSWVSGTTNNAQEFPYTYQYTYMLTNTATTATAQVYYNQAVDYAVGLAAQQLGYAQAQTIGQWAGTEVYREPLPGPDDRAAMEAQRVIIEAERQRTMGEREAAHTRAEELLQQFLSPAQKEMWEREDAFLVETNAHVYKLRRRQNTERLNEHGVPAFSYCIHTYGIPRADELLGFKLLLEANEEEFLRTANATRLVMPPNAVVNAVQEAELAIAY